jgi:hypothetical protein
MKLVIQTQIRENYAAHEGFTGEYYWKMKGGNTYVVRNIDERQSERARAGIPTLTKLIEEMNDYYEEYILDFSVVEDDATECAEWETPIEFSWGGDRWLASRTVRNDEYGYMRREIISKREEWIPLEAGERAHYKSEIQTADGWFSEEEFAKQLAV